MELFERIRRDHDREGLSIRALACRHGVHRRTVREALGSALPPERKRPEGRPAPALGAYHELIDEWLIADRSAPRKQRHTAKRVWERLRDEYGSGVAETTVRDHVRRRRRELGLWAEAFCPQVHDPGVTAEVDWGEAKVLIAGVLVTVGLFLMRSCFSGACFVMAFESQSQQAFLEGHVHAFEFFSGVFATCRYDNLKSAAKKTLRGRRRVENERFVAFRSHYLYESWFTLVGIEGAHEKGGVEGEVGRYRRSHLVPVPQFDSLEQLNGQLAAWCIEDLSRTITGRSVTVGELLSSDRLAAGAAGGAVRDVGGIEFPGQPEVDGHRPAQSLLGARPPRRGEGHSAGRCARDHGAARRQGGRAAPAAAWQSAALRAA
ncbi:MAG: IS21 family transposase [Actinomycetota bacterium]|nr:IS21 family transposase [Actinomycetota bacterium]